jgi:hypothetical protein
MTRRLILVDFENRQKIDLSFLDETYRAIVFVGARRSQAMNAAREAGVAQ